MSGDKEEGPRHSQGGVREGVSTHAQLYGRRLPHLCHRGDLTAEAGAGLPVSLAGACTFRVGQREARSVPERQPAKFRRTGYIYLVKSRRRAQSTPFRAPNMGGNMGRIGHPPISSMISI